ncbi:uncharacterized protein LOC134258680 [Saccostrea cucullata]|uniref:uncharacterized protein LOC134258680 n=1 Tax=Saccostrea cuccullata TaxID=36930 RepID=UPI002ED1F574
MTEVASGTIDIHVQLPATNTGNAGNEAQYSAYAAVKKGLHSVKVAKYDATKLERELEGELFERWHEGCEVMKTTKIPEKKIVPFLNHLQESYEGIKIFIKTYKERRLQWGKKIKIFTTCAGNSRRGFVIKVCWTVNISLTVNPFWTHDTACLRPVEGWGHFT